MYTRILVPVDGSDAATQGLREAAALAQLTGATVRVIHVIDQLSHVTGFESYSAYSGYIVVHLREQGEKILDTACALVRDAGIPFERKLYETGGARLARVVLEDARAWGADLIVLGTHGPTGADRFFLGSGAEEVSRYASIPVLLVRLCESHADDEARDVAATTAA